MTSTMIASVARQWSALGARAVLDTADSIRTNWSWSRAISQAKAVLAVVDRTRYSSRIADTASGGRKIFRDSEW